MILSAILVAFAAAFWAVSTLLMIGESKIDSKKGEGFFGSVSWVRKYKYYYTGSRINFERAPCTWYYRLFDIRYKEKFPLSATALVFLTDGFHLLQFFTIKCIAAAVIVYGGDISIAAFAVMLAAWHLGFNITYRLVRRS